MKPVIIFRLQVLDNQNKTMESPNPKAKQYLKIINIPNFVIACYDICISLDNSQFCNSRITRGSTVPAPTLA